MSTVIWHAHKVMNYYTIVLQDMSKRNMSVVLAKPERDCPKYYNIMTIWEEGLREHGFVSRKLWDGTG